MVFYTFHPLFMVMCINALPVKCKTFHWVPSGFTAAFVLPPVRGSLLFKSLNLVFPRSEVKFSTARDASGSRVTLDAYLKKDPLSLCGQCPLDGPVPVGLLPSPPAKVSPDTGRHQHGWPQFRNQRYYAKLYLP